LIECFILQENRYFVGEATAFNPHSKQQGIKSVDEVPALILRSTRG
jgi:hypothetical protein